jgi:hypothetical protein
MSGDQLRRLKDLEKENERLRRAVSDLTLDKQILAEAAEPRDPAVNKILWRSDVSDCQISSTGAFSCLH